MTCWHQSLVKDTQYAVGDRVWLFNPRKKRGLTPKLQSNWEGPYTILQRLSAVTFKLGDGTPKRPRIVHVDRLWAAVEEGHFMWGRRDPSSTPDSEARSISKVEDNGQIDNVAGCVVGALEDLEDRGRACE